MARLGGPLAVASFQRPADTIQYDAGDLVANSTTAGLVVPMSFVMGRRPGGVGRIFRGRLVKSSAGSVQPIFDVRFYRAPPVVSSGDNAKFAAAGAADWLGNMTFGLTEVYSDGLAGFNVPNASSVLADLRFETDASMKMYALMTATITGSNSGYAPASAETFTLSLEYDAD